jgi:hypothetical protein
MLPLLTLPEPQAPTLNQHSKIYILAFVSSMLGAVVGSIVTAVVLSMR